MNIYKDFSNMVWVTKNGPTRIKNMTTAHIINTIKTVNSNTQSKIWDYSIQEWKTALKLELNRREQLANKIFAMFPKFYNELNQVLKATEPVRTEIKKPISRILTTKGIIQLNYGRTIKPAEKQREVRVEDGKAISLQVKGNQEEKIII